MWTVAWARFGPADDSTVRDSGLALKPLRSYDARCKRLRWGRSWACVVLLHSLAANEGGGIARYARELARHLPAAGEPVRPLMFKPWEVNVGGRRTGGYVSLRLQGLLRPMRKRDLLHSVFHYAPHPRCDVATVHDLFPQQYAELLGTSKAELRFLERQTERLVRRGVQFICDTKATRDAFVRLHGSVPEDRLHVIHLGVDASFTPPTATTPRHPAFDREAFNVLCVADLNPRKRVDWLYEVAARIDDARLRIIHVGPASPQRRRWREQQAREAVWARQLGPRLVRILDPGPHGLLAAYRSADLFVLPSLDEGFGFPPLEALACGAPVAVTDRPVFRETLGEHANYFRDVEDLETVLRDAIRRRPSTSMRRGHSDYVRKRFDWTHTAGRVVTIYDEVRAAARRNAK